MEIRRSLPLATLPPAVAGMLFRKTASYVYVCEIEHTFPGDECFHSLPSIGKAIITARYASPFRGGPRQMV